MHIKLFFVRLVVLLLSMIPIPGNINHAAYVFHVRKPPPNNLKPHKKISEDAQFHMHINYLSTYLLLQVLISAPNSLLQKNMLKIYSVAEPLPISVLSTILLLHY